MDKYYAVVADREMGVHIPVSISTALALESVFGISEDRPEHKLKPPIFAHNELWINIRTLLRNIISSIPSASHNMIFPDPLFDGITSEMQVIEAAVGSSSHNRCKVVFYYQSYLGLERKYPNCFPRVPKTEKQLFMHNLELKLLKRIEAERPEVLVSDTELKGEHPDSMIITHQPVDLLSKYHFKRLVLLESHTGKLKPSVQWSTKLTGGKDLTRIPFNHVTLQFFGDGVHFQTFPSKEKKQFIEMADHNLWTPTTTLSRMKQCIDGWPFHPKFKAILLSMF